MSFSRRLLKTNAKKSISQNYFRMTAVCFLVVLLCGSSYTSTQLFQETPNVEYHELLLMLRTVFRQGDTLSGLIRNVMNVLLDRNRLPWAGFFLMSFVLWIFYKIFIANIVFVGSRRFFMETRMYPKTSIKKLGYLYKGQAVRGPAWTMFCMHFYRGLWWLTIVGGFIKTYEYAMIPYLLAENPGLTKKQAFRLSKEMMRGRKWGLFILHMSFFLWFLLGIVTMGLSNIFYFNAYWDATETEYYMMVRRGIVTQRNKNSHYFVDNYLENRPSEDEILINMFVSEKDYMPNLESDEFSQNVYPMFLRGKASRWYEPPYKKEEERNYPVTTYILLFFLTSVLGWLLDMSIGFVRQGRFPAGGYFYGPWIPVIGVASVLVIFLGRKIEKHPLVNVTFITVFTSTIQYFYGWGMEYVRGSRYWDFSNYLLNLNGRICLASVVTVGALAVALYYLLAPDLNAYLSGVPIRKKRRICMMLCLLFVVDVFVTLWIRI